MDAGTGTEGFILGILNWLAVTILRRFAPRFWEALDKRILRLVLIATTAGILAIINGILAGMGWPDMLRMALSAFAVSIATREVSKEDKPELGGYMPTLSRKLSVRTEVPEPER
jgi:hypothetical protein